VFCKLDYLWCSVWCRNIADRCHSLQSVEIPFYFNYLNN
jgi:hypothetical protein